MLYTSDFKIPQRRIDPVVLENEEDVFTVIIKNDVKTETDISKYSIVNAVKPIVYVMSLFGTQTLRYVRNNMAIVNVFNKTYSLLFIGFTLTIMNIFKPRSWSETQSDLPLNVLTKTFSALHMFEVFHSIIVVTFASDTYYVKILKTLDDVDNKFARSKKMFLKRRIIASGLIIFTIMQITTTMFLRKFHLHNIGAYLTVFVVLLEGTMVIFLVLNIHTSQLMLNSLMLKKIKNLSSKEYLLRDSAVDRFFIKLTNDSNVLKKKIESHYCWFELMYLYDKIADSVYYFNKIYMGQVLVMFLSWLFCTLLVICRFLSPSLNFSEVALSDLCVYVFINIRPLFLAIMCEMFVKERNRTLSLLLHILVHADTDGDYSYQIQTMVELVETRPMKVSANVFTVDIPIVMNFAGRVISYAVLMIQYFYMHF